MRPTSHFPSTPLLYFYIKENPGGLAIYLLLKFVHQSLQPGKWRKRKTVSLHVIDGLSLANKRSFPPLTSCLWILKPQPPDAIGTLLIHQRGFGGGGGGGGCSGSLDRQRLKSERQEERGRVRGGEKEWLANLKKKKGGGGCGGESPFIVGIKDFGGRRSQKTSAV